MARSYSDLENSYTKEAVESYEYHIFVVELDEHVMELYLLELWYSGVRFGILLQREKALEEGHKFDTSTN